MKYVALIVLWIMWCAIHSWMTSLSLNHYLKSKFPNYYRFYRLFFNLVALITLIPLILYSQTLKGPVLFDWDGFAMPLRLFLLAIAVTLFIAGGLKYDMLQFLGIRQIKSGKSHSTLSESGGIDTSGILSITRHPWYLATIIIVWVDHREVYFSTFLVKVLLTIYLIIGTVLEEKKLVSVLGESYRQYRNRVSMLFPAKWITARFFAAKKVDSGDR